MSLPVRHMSSYYHLQRAKTVFGDAGQRPFLHQLTEHTRRQLNDVKAQWGFWRERDVIVFRRSARTRCNRPVTDRQANRSKALVDHNLGASGFNHHTSRPSSILDLPVHITRTRCRYTQNHSAWIYIFGPSGVRPTDGVYP